MRLFKKLITVVRRFPWLSLGFALMLGLTVVFSVRLFHAADRWSAPMLPDEPLAGWMTPRYAARAMHVPPDVVISILNLTADHQQRRATLSMIAAERGLEEAEFLTQLQAAIAADREAQGTPPPSVDLGVPPPPPEQGMLPPPPPPGMAQ